MTAGQIAHALAAWHDGYDTMSIATLLGLRESVVANELPKHFQRRRGGRR